MSKTQKILFNDLAVNNYYTALSKQFAKTQDEYVAILKKRPEEKLDWDSEQDRKFNQCVDTWDRERKESENENQSKITNDGETSTENTDEMKSPNCERLGPPKYLRDRGVESKYQTKTEETNSDEDEE